MKNQPLNREVLQTMKMPELRALAEGYGLTHGFGEKKADFIDRMVLITNTGQPGGKKEPKPEVPAPTNSEEEILQAVAGNIAAGMTVEFDDNTWLFTSPKGTHDSGTCFQPLTNIKRCADLLVKPC